MSLNLRLFSAINGFVKATMSFGMKKRTISGYGSEETKISLWAKVKAKTGLPVNSYSYATCENPASWPTPEAVTVNSHIRSNGFEAHYDAIQTALDRPVIMVVYNGDLADTSSLLQFIEDMQRQARIQYPEIPQIYKSDVVAGRPFYLAEPMVTDPTFIRPLSSNNV